MFLNFRKPFLDETLQGAVARLLGQFPLSHHPQIVRRLLGGPNRAVAVDFPHELGRLCPSLGIDPTTAIERNTLLPLFRPFVAMDTLEAATNAMLGNGNPHFLLGTGPGGGCVSKRLRLCPMCMVADLARFRVPVWRRIHQINQVRFCPDHSLVLVETNVPARPVFQFSFTPAQHASESDRLVVPAEMQPVLLWIAQQLRQLLIIRDCPQPGPIRLAGYYHQRLRELGFIKNNDRIAHTDLMRAFLSTTTPATLELLGCPLDEEARDNWLRRLITSFPAHQPPYRHLLFMRFLKDHPMTALKAALAFVRVQHPSLLRPQFANPTLAFRRTKRAEWLKALRSGATALRTKHDALYSWLWRHDRTWLMKHRPLRPVTRNLRRDWNSIDLALTRKIQAAATCLSRSGHRASWTRLAIASGRPALIAVRHAMIPTALLTIETLAQSAESHAILRLQRVLKSTKAKPGSLKPWRIAKNAGIGRGMRSRPVIAHLLHSQS